MINGEAKISFIVTANSLMFVFGLCFNNGFDEILVVTMR